MAVPEAQRLALVAGLPPEAQETLRYEFFGLIARDAQTPPEGDWTTWLILAGRGFGKTRTGAEWVREQAFEGGAGHRIALVAATAADVRDTLIEGESGILAISPPWFRPKYQPSKRRVVWPNGAVAYAYSADEPDRLRGPQHHKAWGDELAAWKYPDAWDQLQFGLRLGERPRVVVTTTPRPTAEVRELMQQFTTAITRGSTYENRANLPQSFFDKVIRKYEGTRLGRQELYAELLDDTPGALWTRRQLDALTGIPPAELARIVVAVDPSVAADGGGDECGIVVAGLAEDGTAWVLHDGSDKLSPEQWAARTASLYEDHRADRVIAEANNGGALVALTLRAAQRNLPVKLVHAARGKHARAEPVAALYEQKRVRHARGLAKLEDEMCTWAAATGDPSPNRVDALVWALTELCLLGSHPRSGPALTQPTTTRAHELEQSDPWHESDDA